MHTRFASLRSPQQHTPTHTRTHEAAGSGRLKRAHIMTRGHQKQVAREKAEKRAGAHKEAVSQFAARADNLRLTCPVCKAPAPRYNILKAHMESKHPTAPVPTEAELAAGQ